MINFTKPTQLGYVQSQIIGTTSANDFIPFYAIFFSDRVKYKDGTTELIYCLPLPGEGSNMHFAETTNTRIDVIYNALKNKNFVRNYIVSKKRVFLTNGCCYVKVGDGYSILFMLAVNKNYIMSEDFNVNNVDYSKFVLLYNSNFKASKDLAVLRRRLEKAYIKSLLETYDLDVLYTKNIENWCFNPGIKIPKFKSIADMNKHLDGVKKTLWLEETENQDQSL